MAKEVFYFQHDYDARNDIQIKRLRKTHGAAGYGLYWYIVEMMHEDERDGIDIDDSLLESIAEDNGMELETVCKFLQDCLEKYRLFRVENGFYTSDRVIQNKDRREQIRQKKSEAGRKGGLARQANARNFQAPARNFQANARENQAGASSKQANSSKGKESKGKDIKEYISKKQKVFYDQLIPYVDKYSKEMVRAFYEYWHQPNKPMTKLRWELEKAWDLESRLRYWASNDRNFKKGGHGTEQKEPPKGRDAYEIAAEREAKNKRP